MDRDEHQLQADVEEFCREIRPIEDMCYLEYRFNEQTIALGIPVARQYGGRGSTRCSWPIRVPGVIPVPSPTVVIFRVTVSLTECLSGAERDLRTPW